MWVLANRIVLSLSQLLIRPQLRLLIRMELAVVITIQPEITATTMTTYMIFLQ